jgi:20S proteasome subunit beta 3
LGTGTVPGIDTVPHSSFFVAVFEMNPYLWVGLPGLATDTQTVKQKIEFRK